MPLSSKITVGWRESIALPDWHIPALRAKIDTGARTSAIDVDQIELLPDGRVRFDVVLSNKHRRRRKWITADVVRTTTIRSSNGERDTRYVVATTLSLGGLKRLAEFTLVRRENMLCRMLIGRSALTRRYLVDVSRTYVTKPRSTKPKSPLSP
ncbi:ATP-dependent zinc protease family protein [Synoicihabitans lomoniglobus]|uniref:RimK/LysX family protein n=1 Tax=Synoicihabitans lomoniglobus TaxID=2909285 RepID=A0AAE9ZW29_9BACT|nr:RimK/LysX family protein [Opitutaceae bacterium LMO-M01]WED63940.1 RimK/LysX family protein [Opitutaceae bacterium LMO-M01]